MGRYFGIGNTTKHHIISQGTSCWKHDDFCECHAVMHQSGWDASDDIYSCCYDTYCEFKYDGDTETMECIQVSDDEQKDGEGDECDQGNKGDASGSAELQPTAQREEHKEEKKQQEFCVDKKMG